MNPRILLLVLCALWLAPVAARAQDQPNGADTSAILSSDSQNSVLLKRMWRTLSGGLAVTTANPATTRYVNQSLSSTPWTAKSSAGIIYAWNVINPNSTAVYLKGYDTASPVVGTTPPSIVYAIPANSGMILPRSGYPHTSFANAVTLAVVTGLADNSTGAPTTGIYVQAAISQ